MIILLRWVPDFFSIAFSRLHIFFHWEGDALACGHKRSDMRLGICNALLTSARCLGLGHALKAIILAYQGDLDGLNARDQASSLFN